MNQTQDTSHSMIEALSSGNQTEFEDGYRRFCSLYHGVIRRWCQRWFKDENEADDAAQDLLISLHRRLKKYKPEKGIRFRNWLSKVSKNLSRDVIRKRNKDRVRFVSTSESDESIVSDYMGELFIEFERKELLKKALVGTQGRISEKDQRVLQLYLDDHSTSEIADEVDSNPNSVHQAMFRVRKEFGQEINMILKRRGLEEADLFVD
ncbi:sigma-70 family RNA polymerase sigma factor [uncultured Rubinisphaera sp.]|uniref:RNA polymerase sigma factor n=1 Tax=uncultured Rubinisphaera sp. TaxID=1678686 RepID=UPI0030DC0E28